MMLQLLRVMLVASEWLLMGDASVDDGGRRRMRRCSRHDQVIGTCHGHWYGRSSLMGSPHHGRMSQQGPDVLGGSQGRVSIRRSPPEDGTSSTINGRSNSTTICHFV